VKIGAVFPTTEIGNDPVAIRDWAQAAEALGYSHVLVYDHVLGAVHAGREPRLAGPYTERDAFHEPLVLLGFLAGVTERLELATGVLILPQRQTALVAKQAAEVDVLSGGRLRLGVGTGWNFVEYESLGTSFADRGRRFDEQVELLRRLWREPTLDFRGRHHRIDRAGILPRPRPDLPLWFGGFTEPALRRAARVGDGFVFGAAPSRVRGLLARLEERLAAEGRDRARFGTEASVDFSEEPERARRELELWRELGGSHLSLRAMDTAAAFVGAHTVGYPGPQAYIDALRTFMERIR
jgi:probable F420-dependent oxidoreductase